MFKAIIDWFLVNYEIYLLVGIGFALLDIYGTLREAHRLSRITKVSVNVWFFIFPILVVPFYPLFITIWLLNKLAQWE